MERTSREKNAVLSLTKLQDVTSRQGKKGYKSRSFRVNYLLNGIRKMTATADETGKERVRSQRERIINYLIFSSSNEILSKL